MSCARCGRAMHAAEGAATPAETLASAAESGIDLEARTGSGDLGDWDLEQTVRRVQARVGTWRRFDAARGSGQPSAYHSFEPSKRPKVRRRRRADDAHAMGRPHFRRSARPKRLSTFGWMWLSLGLAAFACGTALLVCSWLEGRDELWKLGLPVAIGGQVALFVGVLLHLERVWQNGRLAVVKLDEVDQQLRHLERQSSGWSPARHTASQAFYAHMAESASPEILLADLQGQLELLSHQVSRRR